MKKYSIFILLIFSACSSVSNISIPVLEPGAISINKNINDIALVNRSIPEKKGLNIVEGILTGEGIGEDKQNRQEMLAGLQANLSQSPRFNVKLTPVEFKGSTIGNTLPQALSWQEIDKICKEYNVQGVLSIESFDTDCITAASSKNLEKTEKDGSKKMITEFYADQTIYIKYAIRLYNNVDRTIEDQFNDTYSMKWHTKGTTPQDALNSLLNKKAASAKTSFEAGVHYGYRISPSWVNVRRSFYKKGSSDLEMAGRKAMVGDWNQAEQIWKNAVNNNNSKVAGRAAFNLAVRNEVAGNLGTAKEWAMKSFSDYNNKKAKNYSFILDQRIMQQQKLDHQMSSTSR